MRMRWFWTLCGVLAFGLFSAGCDTQTPGAEGKAKLRVVHLSYDGPAVDVYVGENKAITALAYGAGSAYLEVDAGKDLAIKVTETGKTEPALISTTRKLEKDKSYTIVAADKAASITAIVLDDDNTAPAAGKAKVRVFHGAPDAPAVEVKPGAPDAAALFQAAFKSATGYKEVDAGSVAIVLTEVGKTEAVISFQPIALDAGKIYTIFAKGTLSTEDQAAFGLRAFVDNGEGAGKDNVDLQPAGSGGEDKAKVRVLHMSYDGPAVDVAVNGTKAITALPYGQSSGYAEIPTGKPTLKVTETGKTEPALIEASPDLEKDKSYTVVAYGPAAQIAPLLVADAREPVAGKAKLRVIHAAEAPTVDIKAGSADSAPVFAALERGKATDYAEVDPMSLSVVITAAGQNTAVITYKAVMLEAGKVYTAVARGSLAENNFGVRVFIDNDEGKASVDLEAQTASEDKAKVRVLHMSYDGPAVDVAVNGTKAITALPYGQSSGYAEIPTGKPTLKVTETGKTEPALIEASPDLEKDKSYTVVAYGPAAQIAPLLVADAREPVAGKAKLRVIHAAEAPTVDIKAGSADSAPVFAALERGKATDYAEVDPMSLSVVITAAGQNTAVITYKAVMLEAGKVYTAVARGSLAENNFGVRVFIDNDEGKTSVDLEAEVAGKSNLMVVHASPDAPSVDLYLDENKVNGDPLEFPNNTGYLQIDAGARKVAVNPAGSNTSVISDTLTFDPNKSYSLFAINVVASIEAIATEDDLTPPAAGKAHIRFLHLSPDAPAVDIAVKGGPTLFPNSKFKDVSDFLPVDAASYDIEVRVAGTNNVALELNGINLEAGKIYTVFAKGLLAGQGNQALGAQIIVNNP